MLFGGIRGAEAEMRCDLGSGGRESRLLQMRAQQLQDFGLARGQVLHVGLRGWVGVPWRRESIEAGRADAATGRTGCGFEG